jgi:hypothetical protein
MKIRLSDNSTENVITIDPDVMSVFLTSVFNPVTLITSDNEELHIVMRDSGYELVYIANGDQCQVRLNNGVITCEGQ